MSDGPGKASPQVGPLDDIILGEELGDDATTAPTPPVAPLPHKASVPPPALGEPRPSKQGSVRPSAPPPEKDRKRAKMTLRIPDDEVSRPNLPATTPLGGVAAARSPSRPPSEADIAEAAPAPPMHALPDAPHGPDDTLELPSEELNDRITTLDISAAPGIDAGNEPGWTPYQPSVEPSNGGGNGAPHPADLDEPTRIESDVAPASEDIPIEMDDAPAEMSSGEELATRPRLPATLDSDEIGDIRIEDPPERHTDPEVAEVAPEDLVSVESIPTPPPPPAKTFGRYPAFKGPSTATALMADVEGVPMTREPSYVAPDDNDDDDELSIAPAVNAPAAAAAPVASVNAAGFNVAPGSIAGPHGLGVNAPGAHALPAPGVSAPGVSAPTAPGVNAPGAPGVNPLGMNAPGVSAPGANAPGMNAPGVNALGVNAAGVNPPGVNAPGVNALGMHAPGVNAPAVRPPSGPPPAGVASPLVSLPLATPSAPAAGHVAPPVPPPAITAAEATRVEPGGPTAAAALGAPAVVPGAQQQGNRIIVPQVGVLAPPPMTDNAAQRKKTRPWWEDLFNDDYIRTMAKISDEQIGAECTFIEESLGCEAGATVLDLACGTGRHAVDMAARGYQVVGFDLSLSMLARASDEAQERGMKINFVQGDMREMTFEETFDGIFCWNTSFGFFDEEKNNAVIAKVHRALKKGGQFLLDVVNRDYIIRQAPSLAWFEGDGCICMDEMQIDFITSRMRVKRTLMMDDGRTKEIEYSIRIYSLHELGKLLHDNGFRVAEVSGRTATPGVFFGTEAPRTLILAERR